MKAVFALCVVAVAVTCIFASTFLDVDGSETQIRARDAAKNISGKLSEKTHHILVKVVTSQRVNDDLYVIRIILGLTDCLKSEVEYDQTDECELKNSVSTYKNCIIVYKDMKMLSFGCTLTSKSDFE